MIAPPRPPSHEELEALIREARARQMRRRLRGAAGVAVVAALGLSVYALFGGGNAASLGTGRANAGGATGPRCRASQLAATVGFQGATQTLLGGADIKNVSGRACSLPLSWPKVRIWSGVKRLPVVQRRPSGYRRFAEKPVRVLVPGQVANIEMQWANWCGSRSLPHERFVIGLGSGLTLTAPIVAAPPCFAPGYPSKIFVDRPRELSR